MVLLPSRRIDPLIPPAQARRARKACRAFSVLETEIVTIFDDFPRGVTGRDDRHAPLATAAWRFDAPLWREGHIWLGRDEQGRAVGHADDRHMITVAGSRSGKGRSCLIPNLFLWPGSCVVIDPKGENASVTAERRARRPGHSVVVIDPCGSADVPDALRASFNPLDLIDADDDEAIDLAAAIGDAIMIGSGDGKDIHWNESARQIFEGLLLHVAVTEDGARRSLVRVRQLLTQGDTAFAATLNAERVAAGEEANVSPFDALWTAMSESRAVNEAVRDVIVGAAASVADMGENERGSVLSTARRNSKFIESPWQRRCLEGGGRTLDIDALKTSPGGVSVYVCLPARFFPTHARFLRLVLNLTLYRMEALGLDRPACGHNVLFLLDEFAALGRMESIEKAAGLMAGYGVKLWPVLQDVQQLKRLHKEAWETFMANAGVLQFFANADMTTLEWLSKRMGQVELIRETCGSSDSSTTSLSKSQSLTETGGWSRSSGSSTGSSDMAELQSMAAREGGQQGLVPFFNRAKASGRGHSHGSSSQDGVSGGESRQQGDSSSCGSSTSVTVTAGIHQVALMTPAELAQMFDRRSGRQVVLIDGVPVALARTNYDGDAQFTT